jgi:hypothetical protein
VSIFRNRELFNDLKQGPDESVLDFFASTPIMLNLAINRQSLEIEAVHRLWNDDNIGLIVLSVEEQRTAQGIIPSDPWSYFVL